VKAIKYLSFIWMTIICVMVFSADFALLSELYKTGKVRFEQDFVLDDNAMPEDLFFESPSTISCDPQGNIYVVDSGAKNVKKFDVFSPEGEFISNVIIPGEASFPTNHNAYIIHDRSLLLLKTGDDELYRLICYKFPE